MTRRLSLPPPDPYTGPRRCPACSGLGVTGDRYEQDTGTGVVLVIDEVCPDCVGCGSAEHASCRPEQHATADADEWMRDYDYEANGAPCPSCHGRQWYGVQAFDDERVTYLRMPCGCAEALMVPAA